MISHQCATAVVLVSGTILYQRSLVCTVGVMLASSTISYQRSPILLSGRFRTDNMPFDVPVSHRFRAVRIVPERSKPATLSTNSQRKSTKKTTLVRNRTSISIPVRKKKPKHRR